MVLSSPIGNRSIVSDGTVNGFIKKVEENPPGEHELNSGKLAFQKEQLTELFRFYRSDYLIRSISKLVADNKGAFPEVSKIQLEKIRNAFESQIADVAEKFHTQISSFLRQQPDVTLNEKLQERIKKAAVYFGEKVQEILVEGIKKTDLEIDNKTIKRQLKRYTDDLAEEAAGKVAAFNECRAGFDVRQIMDARAKSLVANSKTKTGKQKAKEITDFENVPHPELFNQLRAYRTEKASELEVAAFMIFSQKVLYELVNYLPTDAKSLKLINGLGNRKIEQFGADIVAIIQHYVNENNIDKGEIPLRETAPKEKKPKVDTKLLTFALFQSGKSIEEIAKERALTQNTIENHLAHYVKKGEIEISEFLDESKLKRICNYFEKAESKSFSEAKVHFGAEVSYGELRMALSYLESLKTE
jgi:hypothetical protein